MADQHWTAVNAMASGMGTAADRPPHDESDDEGSFERTSSYSEAMTSPTPPTRKAAGSRAWMDRPPEPDAPDAPAPQPPHSDMALPDSEEESWEETARRESELPSQSTSRTSTASAASSAEPVEPADMDTATAAPHPTEIMFGKENVGKVHLRSQVKASWFAIIEEDREQGALTREEMSMESRMRAFIHSSPGVQEHPLPRLVVSIGGGHGNDDSNPSTVRMIQRGLRKLAHMLPIWIVTSGTNYGIAKIVGEAMADVGVGSTPNKWMQQDSHATSSETRRVAEIPLIGMCTYNGLSQSKRSTIEAERQLIRNDPKHMKKSLTTLNASSSSEIFKELHTASALENVSMRHGGRHKLPMRSRMPKSATTSMPTNGLQSASNPMDPDTRFSSSEDSVDLEPNHTTFFLSECDDVDSYGHFARFGPEHRMWASFVAGLRRTRFAPRDVSDRDDDHVNSMDDKWPRIHTVHVMVGGGETAIHQLAHAAIEGTPILIVEGTGRAADVLAYAWRLLHESSLEAQRHSYSELQEMIVRLRIESFKTIEAMLEWQRYILDIVIDSRAISVWNCETSDSSLDQAIAHTLMSALLPYSIQEQSRMPSWLFDEGIDRLLREKLVPEAALGAYVYNLEKLHLSRTFRLVDAARTAIGEMRRISSSAFSTGERLQQDLHCVLLWALSNQLTDFVRIVTPHVDLHSFVYEKSIFAPNYDAATGARLPIFKLHTASSTRPHRRETMAWLEESHQAGVLPVNLATLLLPKNNKSALYLEMLYTHFGGVLQGGEGDSDITPEYAFNAVNRLLAALLLPGWRVNAEYKCIGKTINPSSIKWQNGGKKKVMADRACQDLLIWACLSNNHALAKFFWQHGGNSLATALTAATLLTKLAGLHSLAARGSFKKAQAEMIGLANEFEQLAIGTLQTCHARSPAMTTLLLTAKIRHMVGFQRHREYFTPMALAQASQRLDFMSEPAFLSVVEEEWYGAMDAATPLWRIALAAFLWNPLWLPIGLGLFLLVPPATLRIQFDPTEARRLLADANNSNADATKAPGTRSMSSDAARFTEARFESSFGQGHSLPPINEEGSNELRSWSAVEDSYNPSPNPRSSVLTLASSHQRSASGTSCMASAAEEVTKHKNEISYALERLSSLQHGYVTFFSAPVVAFGFDWLSSMTLAFIFLQTLLTGQADGISEKLLVQEYLVLAWMTSLGWERLLAWVPDAIDRFAGLGGPEEVRRPDELVNEPIESRQLHRKRMIPGLTYFGEFGAMGGDLADSHTAQSSLLWFYVRQSTEPEKILDFSLLIMYTFGFWFRRLETNSTGTKFQHQMRARWCYAWVVIALFIRLGPYLSYFEFLGPKLFMISQMSKDISAFLVLWLLLFFSYIGAISSITFGPPGGNQQQSFMIPMFQMFGELFLDELSAETICVGPDNFTSCPWEQHFVWIFTFAYVFLTTIVLVNLLIAMMAETYSKVQEKATQYWNEARYQKLVKYLGRTRLPHPLYILSWVYVVGRRLQNVWLLRRKRIATAAKADADDGAVGAADDGVERILSMAGAAPTGPTARSELVDHAPRLLESFQENCTDDFVADRHEQAATDKETLSRRQERTHRIELDLLSTNVVDVMRSVEDVSERMDLFGNYVEDELSAIGNKLPSIILQMGEEPQQNEGQHRSRKRRSATRISLVHHLRKSQSHVLHSLAPAQHPLQRSKGAKPTESNAHHHTYYPNVPSRAIPLVMWPAQQDFQRTEYRYNFLDFPDKGESTAIWRVTTPATTLSFFEGELKSNVNLNTMMLHDGSYIRLTKLQRYHLPTGADEADQESPRIHPLHESHFAGDGNERVDRVPVDSEVRSWVVPCPGYAPRYFTSPNVIRNPRAHPEDVTSLPDSKSSIVQSFHPVWTYSTEELERVVSDQQPLYGDLAAVPEETDVIDSPFHPGAKLHTLLPNTIPLHPRGRTGLRGRGHLYKWGPNRCVDMILTRWRLSKSLSRVERHGRPMLEVLLVQRPTGPWAIPGSLQVGALEPGKCPVPPTILEKFGLPLVRKKRRTMAGPDGGLYGHRDDTMRDVLENYPTLHYSGVAGDDRDTDNAWMETEVYHLHINDALRNLFELIDDFSDTRVAWAVAHPHMVLYNGHQNFIHEIVEGMKASWSVV